MSDQQEPQSEGVDVAAIGQVMNEMAHAPDMTVEDAKDRYEEIVKEPFKVVEEVEITYTKDDGTITGWKPVDLPNPSMEEVEEAYQKVLKDTYEESSQMVSQMVSGNWEAIPTYPFKPDYSTESLAVGYAQYIGFVKTEIEKIHYPKTSERSGYKSCAAEYDAWPCKTIRVIREAEAKFGGNDNVGK